MPMNTTFDKRSSFSRSSDAKRAACSKISASLRCLRKPICPVAQNVHPIAQPTCDEMHAVRRRVSYGMSTDSISESSVQRHSRLRVPSWLTCSAATCMDPRVARSPNPARSALGRLFMSSKVFAGLSPYSHALSCLALYFGCPSSTISSASSVSSSA
eukprot:scaffold33410_cov26-Tisochrysis_lutea.AAC.2